MAAAGLLTLGVALVIATTPLHAQTESIDVKNEARAIVANVRDLVLRTKKETSLETSLQNILHLQSITVNLIAHLPAKRISECETQTVIKLAAAGIGNHDVLDVLLAEDDVGVLGARIRLSLTFLNRLAQHLDDKLSLSSDVGPELTAITFGANTTAASIITIFGHTNHVRAKWGSRGRREANSSLSVSGRVGATGDGQLAAQANVKYNNGNVRADASGSVDSSGKGELTGSVGVQSTDKRTSLEGTAGVRTNPGRDAEIFGGAKITVGSRDGRFSANAQGGVQVGQSGKPQPYLNANIELRSKDGRFIFNAGGGFQMDQSGKPQPTASIAISTKISSARKNNNKNKKES